MLSVPTEAGVPLPLLQGVKVVEADRFCQALG